MYKESVLGKHSEDNIRSALQLNQTFEINFAIR